jgi:hypothetical protein
MFLAFLAFFGFALPDGVLGVSWPSMRLDLGVPIGALGRFVAVARSGFPAR